MKVIKNKNTEDKTKVEYTVNPIIQVKKEILKPYLKDLKRAANGRYTVKRISTKGALAGIEIELSAEHQASPVKTIELGYEFEKLKYTTAAAQVQKEVKDRKKKAEEENIIQLKFHRQIVKEFKERYRDQLRLVKVIADGSDIQEFQFDVSDCINRTQLVERIFQISDAVNDVTKNKSHGRDKRHIENTARHLQKNCGYMQQVNEHIVMMTGEELIKKGYATIWDRADKKSGVLQKIWNFVFGVSQEKDYYYFNMIVEREQAYMVKLRKPKAITPREFNYNEVLWKRYIYGEYAYPGYGIELVDKFQQEIIDAHNEHLSNEPDTFDDDGKGLNPKVPPRKSPPPSPPKPNPRLPK